MSIIIFILILAILVLVHELGHFLAAKKNAVKVEEFGIGFPPRIVSRKIGETIYSLNAIPLGGFVKLYGEEHEEIKLKNKAFVYKKPWQKALIIIAGVIGNFILGWLLISYLFTQGIPTPINKVLLEKISPDSPAMAAGLKENDFIYQVKADGKEYPVTSATDLVNISKKFAGKNLTLSIERAGKKLEVVIVPRQNPPVGQGPLGIVITSFVEKKYAWFQAPFYGLIESFSITKKVIVELIKTLVGFLSLKRPQVEVAGPIGIAAYTGTAIKFGKNAVLELIALLSLNLAIINILPFPALDGGRLIFVVYEWISKRRVNEKIERYTNFIGIIILLSLAVLISLNDLARLIR